MELQNIFGPNLIIAGAGTGKTTAIVAKILQLIEAGIPEENILAVTFTNKAANEMKERIKSKTLRDSKINCGTFHGICLKLLKVYHKAVEMEANFIILDDSDKKKVIKNTCDELEIDTARYPIKLINFIISAIKNSGIHSEDDIKISNFKYQDLDIAGLFSNYQKKLKNSNTLDFDDLILKTVKLFFEREDILSDIQDKYKYIFVDEYQDTNELQHKLINKLASKYRNITCVGDEDQSIYGWRGAEIKHILNFPKEFPELKITKLEKNYRSTQEILDTAKNLIKNNKDRYEKNLISDKKGIKPIYKVLDDNRAEVYEMVNDIVNLNSNFNIDKKDMAILIRSSFQTRSIEEILIEKEIAYEIVDGVQFYDRKEIKDLISYLKFLYNNKDFMSFERLITNPKRGIGEKKVEEIIKLSLDSNKNILETMKIILDNNIFSSKINIEIEKLLQNIERWKEKIERKEAVGDLIEDIYHNSGYGEKLIEEIKENNEDKAKLDNIKEFISFAKKFNSLEEFLDHISLIYTLNESNKENEDKIRILTMHASKGLEFKAVFIPNLEEDIIPNKRTIEENYQNLEEERRLLYVAITRAKEYLYIYRAKERYLFGKMNQTRESLFLNEIKDTIEISEKSREKNYNLNYGNNKIDYRKQYIQHNSVLKKIADKNNNNSRKAKIKENDQVFHEKFGKGIVKSKMKNFLEIQFEDNIKRFIQEDFISKNS